MGNQADPLNQFGSLFATLTTARAHSQPLTGDDLLSEVPGVSDAGEKIATNLALRTSLTKEAATVIAKKAVDDNKTDATKAAAQAAAQAAAPSGSVELQLSKPNPLSEDRRLGFAIAMMAVLAGTIILIIFVKGRGLAEYVSGAVLGGLAWLSAVLFVMGYQTVDIKGSTGTSSSSSADSSSSAPSGDTNGSSGLK